MILHDNHGHSSAPAMPHVYGMGAHFLSPSHISLLPAYGRGATEKLLSGLRDFLPFLSLPKANMSGPFTGCVAGLAHPQSPSEAMLCLGLCYTQ